MSEPQNSSPELDIELLSFRIDDQEYCVDIMSVREIRGWTNATPLPYAPPHVKGVINLRGTVLPVVDLSARLGMPPIDAEDRNVIIVVKIDGELVGLLVDAVSDILTVPREELQSPPELGADPSARCVESLLLIEGKLIRVLDLAVLLPREARDAA
ncbi:purine-binding chemotaxis protein CheW [Paracoccus isoporae]|uniref:Purine-binding chemotaxis protein CheW n=1 Tax=Paracoccus isoporae TaxID=591205 RepID=A0A1G6WEK1_9RHOB|nr:chemotaxis protein CheW [Paracoccus isoporae]SDD63495.1 purine-binding chemotaxis protein CheW [Paracoccus isoporae]